MNRLIGIVLILLLIVGGVGYYQGWFSFSKTTEGGNVHMGVTVDKQKIEADEAAAKKKAEEVGQKIKEQVKPATDKSK